MAATGIAAFDDSFFIEAVESGIVKYLHPAFTSRDFLRFATPGNSNVATFVLYSKPGSIAAAPASDITDIASTALADTQIQATAAEIGFRVDVSDVLRAISVANVVADVSEIVAENVTEKWETDLAALMDDFSNVTTAGSTLTALDLLAAVSALEQRDVSGPFVAYLDPKQTGELRADIATTTASYNVNHGDNELVKPFGNAGFFGSVMGIPVWQTSLVVTTSSLVGGAVFASKQALGCLELWGPRIETQRDASNRTLEIIGTQCYGFAEISDTRGQTIKSAA